MHAFSLIVMRALWLGVATVALLLAACQNSPSMSSTAGNEQGVLVDLGSSQEVPPVDAPGSANGTINVTASGEVSGSITTSNVAGTAAHIHMGAVGKNGPVIVSLKKSGDNTWSVPAGTRFKPDQMAAYKAGNLYINVHTAAHKNGEVRGQIIP